MDSFIQFLTAMTIRRCAAWLLLALLGGCAAHFAERPPIVDLRNARDADAIAQIRALGRNGDWLIIRGYHLSDNLVASATNAPFSHAAVLDLDNGGVIEAEAPGVHTTSLAAFVAKAHRLILVRPVWSDERTSEAAVSKARDVVGKPYDFLGLIGFNVPEQYYCSELNLEIYRPYIRREDLIPRPIEPVQLIYWGRVLFDSGAL